MLMTLGATFRLKGIVGRTYYERGEPVVVLIQWGKGGGPRNVLIERPDGSKVVRPSRGLRRRPKQSGAGANRV
jgi:hypothetical protein